MVLGLGLSNWGKFGGLGLKGFVRMEKLGFRLTVARKMCGVCSVITHSSFFVEKDRTEGLI